MMSQVETQTQPTSLEEPTQESAEVSIREILDELQGIPREYWFNLLQIIHYFRESVTLNSESLVSVKHQTESQSENAEILANQHEALKKLTKQWIEEGDEQEQTETWEYLRQALGED